MLKPVGKIDFHMHTTVSDGTDSPEEIILKVKEAGICLFSVTDHDAIEGALTIQKLLTQEASDELKDLVFFPGVEFSCQDEYGKYHILGYRYDPEKPALPELVQVAHQIRLNKVFARLDFLKREFGFTFRQEDIDALFLNHNPGKPHIAKMMMAYGYAQSIEDAMKRFLNKKKFPDSHIHPEKAIHAILESGGIPVLAHPAYGDGGQLILGDEMDQRIRYLMDFGLKGMECYYSTFTPKIIQEMLALAQRYHLFVTAGSDYHGSNKLVQLGDTNLPSLSEADPGLRSFLEDVL